MRAFSLFLRLLLVTAFSSPFVLAQANPCACKALEGMTGTNGGTCCWTVAGLTFTELSDPPLDGSSAECGDECPSQECHYDWILSFTIIVPAGCTPPTVQGCFFITGMAAPLCAGVSYVPNVATGLTIHNGLLCGQDMVAWLDIAAAGCEKTDCGVSEVCDACQGR